MLKSCRETKLAGGSNSVKVLAPHKLGASEQQQAARRSHGIPINVGPRIGNPIWNLPRDAATPQNPSGTYPANRDKDVSLSPREPLSWGRPGLHCQQQPLLGRQCRGDKFYLLCGYIVSWPSPSRLVSTPLGELLGTLSKELRTDHPGMEIC